ncbi:unnamed protein product [Larinioides sclopetarius]|uniref:Secreted protein n=1 Tax=Larinioides sclopetarius TaxID=280406 RepID=A0AAV1ZAR5_9ARAC
MFVSNQTYAFSRSRSCSTDLWCRFSTLSCCCSYSRCSYLFRNSSHRCRSKVRSTRKFSCSTRSCYQPTWRCRCSFF